MAGLPIIEEPSAGDWYRCHEDRPDSPDDGCWYFHSRPEDTTQTPDGRFDLARPDGTCYLGRTEGVAVRERVGRFLASGMPVPPEVYRGRVVSRVALTPADSPVADLTHPGAALQGVTAEIHTIADYRLTTRWADAIRMAGFAGLRYQPRFTPGSETAIALFDQSGPHPSRGKSATRSLAAALEAAGYNMIRSSLPSSITMGPLVDDDLEPPTSDGR